MTERQVPFYCPYCGEQDIRPSGPEGGGWQCASCARAFELRFAGVASATADRAQPGASLAQRGADRAARGPGGTQRGADRAPRGADGTQRGADGTQRGADGTQRGADR
jgi:hypothetical protein